MIAFLALLACLVGPLDADLGQESPQDAIAKLIEIDALEGAAADERVTVLYNCGQAEAVGAAGTVSRSFDGRVDLRMQPDARANSIFVTGRVELVREALNRLRALDESTPEQVRPKRRTSEDPGEQVEDFAVGYGKDIEALGTSSLLIAGSVLGVALLLLILSRRMFR